jgi:hypothetical protein
MADIPVRPPGEASRNAKLVTIVTSSARLRRHASVRMAVPDIGMAAP